MPHLGDFALETTFDFKFTTRIADGTPTNAASDTVVVYEDNSATEITAAETLTQPFDSRTGLANLRVACTAANGFETNKSYAAVYSAGTVGGVSVVGEVICTWTIEKCSGLSNAALANLSNFLDGTGYAGGAIKLEVDMQELDGSAAAAANLNAAADNYSATRGLAGTALPAVAAGSAGGVPTDTDSNGAVRIVDGTGAREINTASGTVTVGTNNDKTGYTASTVSDKTGYSLSTAGILAIWHQLTAAVVTASTMGKLIVDNLNATITSRQPSGAVDLNADQSAVTVGTVNTVGDKTGYSLAATGLDAISQGATGMVEIAKAVWDRVLSGGTHNISTSAGWRVRQIQEAGGYSGGYIYIDTVNGIAGTEDYVNGVDSNPVDSIANANTLAASLGISNFRIAAGSSITFAATQSNQTFEGSNWTLALGGQSMVGTVIQGATVSGIAAGVGTTQKFIDCIVNACTHRKGTHFIGCSIAGTQTVGEAGDYFLDRCHSGIAGTATWVWDFGAVANTNLNVRNYSGGVQLENMNNSGTDTASIEGQGQIVEGTCTGGTVSVRGNFSISGQANITFTETANINIANINAEVVDALNVDTYTEPGQEAPGVDVSLVTKIGYLYKSFRNRSTSDTSEIKLYNSDDITVDQKTTHSDDGVTYDRGEMGSGV